MKGLSDIQSAIIPVFCAYEVHDEQGRHKTLLSIHRNKPDAEFAAKNRGWYGGPGYVQMKHAVEDELDLYLLEAYTPYCFADITAQREAEKQARVDAVLAKLSFEEIELLKGALK